MNPEKKELELSDKDFTSDTGEPPVRPENEDGSEINRNFNYTLSDFCPRL